jgi:hypothetical protein
MQSTLVAAVLIIITGGVKIQNRMANIYNHISSQAFSEKTASVILQFARTKKVQLQHIVACGILIGQLFDQ